MPRARAHRVAVHLISKTEADLYWAWNTLLAVGLVLESEHSAAGTFVGEWETEDTTLLSNVRNVANVVLLPPKEEEPAAKIVLLPPNRVSKTPKRRSA